MTKVIKLNIKPERFFLRPAINGLVCNLPAGSYWQTKKLLLDSLIKFMSVGWKLWIIYILLFEEQNQ